MAKHILIAIFCLTSLLSTPIHAQELTIQESPTICPSADAQIVTINTINPDGSFKLQDGRTIKLLGLDETSPSNLRVLQPLLTQLTTNAQVKIIITGSKDRWGRIGAQIFVQPVESETQAWLQGFLVQYGYARLSLESFTLEAKTFPCASTLKALEREARFAKIGLWQDLKAILPSDNTAALMQHRGEMVLTEGQVLSIGEGRGVFYLNFGQSWQKDLTVIILKKYTKQFELAGLSPRALQLKHVVIRGIVDGDKEPRMEVQNPNQIEIMD